MKIVTHPSNKHYLESLLAKPDEERKKDLVLPYDSDFVQGIFRINNGIQITYDEYIEAEEWTGRWLTLKDRFSTFWDGVGEPPSWTIYFGFVKKEMRPKIIMIDESKLRGMKFWSPNSFSVMKPRFSIINSVA